MGNYLLLASYYQTRAKQNRDKKKVFFIILKGMNVFLFFYFSNLFDDWQRTYEYGVMVCVDQ